MSRAGLRDRASLAAQAAILDGFADKAEGEFQRGAAAALRWLLDDGPGPVTGQLHGDPTAPRSIVRELAAAEAEIYGPRPDSQAYARGIEHALMWAQYVTSTAPGTPTLQQPSPLPVSSEAVRP